MDRIAGDGQSVPTDDVFGSGLAIQLRNASTGAPVPNAPTAFTITSLRETAFPGEVFANPLVVRVLDAQGAPPPEQDVVLTFSISGWAAFPDRADSVDVQLTTDGTATAPSMTAGPVAAPVVINVQVADASVTPTQFVETVKSFTPTALMVISGSGESAPTDVGFSVPLVAQVREQSGNGLANATVTFTVTGPASFANGTTAGIGTDVNGNAQAPDLTAGPTPGAVTVSAAVGELASSAAFNETVVARVPTSVIATSGSGQ